MMPASLRFHYPINQTRNRRPNASEWPADLSGIRTDASIPWTYGTPELRQALVEFARGRVTMMSAGLPQTLIINKDGLVTTRFNGWYFGDDIDELQKSVDEALRNP